MSFLPVSPPHAPCLPATFSLRIPLPCPGFVSRFVQRRRCPHRHHWIRDSYLEEVRGHYDEHICIRQVTVRQCWECGKRQREVEELAEADVEDLAGRGIARQG
jgi:hypothetical protein